MLNIPQYSPQILGVLRNLLGGERRSFSGVDLTDYLNEEQVKKEKKEEKKEKKTKKFMMGLTGGISGVIPATSAGRESAGGMLDRGGLQDIFYFSNLLKRSNSKFNWDPSLRNILEYLGIGDLSGGGGR